jgi:hypothetical protein
MAHVSEIAALEERRRGLIADSDRLREQVAAEVAHLHTTALWFDRGYAWAQLARHVWPLLAGAAGLFAARKSRGVLGTLTRILSWWRLGRRLVDLWGLLSAAASPPGKAT